VLTEAALIYAALTTESLDSARLKTTNQRGDLPSVRQRSLRGSYIRITSRGVGISREGSKWRGKPASEGSAAG
jgi:hypothetical protein